MRFTSSYAVFRAEPGEEDLARARYLAREGQHGAAEREYRETLEKHPVLPAGWIELFELLRQQGRHQEALEAAEAAASTLGPEAAMPLALKGAALAELGRTREALRALEGSLERDGNLALAWHELAYAAYKLGEYPRALLALDRAFMLEPHTDTLMLRGRILREAGQYEAAEVAFEGAIQAADYDIPRREAERENLVTRRAASLGGQRPRDFTPRQRAFMQLGTIVVEPEAIPVIELPDSFARCIAALPPLLHAIGWRPAVVAGASARDAELAAAVALSLALPVAPVAAIDPADRPLLVTTYNTGSEEWAKHFGRLARWRSGHTFALAQSPAATDPADIAGRVGALDPELVRAAADAAMAQGPAEPPDTTEALALLGSPQSPWRRRLVPDRHPT